MKTGGGIGRRPVEERGNKRKREVEERRREIGGWRREQEFGGGRLEIYHRARRSAPCAMHGGGN